MTSDQPPQQYEIVPPSNDREVAHQHFFREFVAQMAPKTNTEKQDLADGPIKSLDIPSLWNRSDSYESGVGSIVTFKPGVGDASITSMEHNSPISDRAAQDFKRLLADNIGNTKPKVLTLAEIRSLTEVLGSTTMGDNQYTNSNGYPSPNAPMFKLNNVHILNINGKAVLEVEGSYMDQDGKPSELYKGILSPSGKDGKHINELFLAAPNRQEMVQQEGNYLKAKRSISWR
ncbi:MAG: hypothetical protein K8F91_05150 [Candidatus Obscuribacterales bacterium]|nr:hypothetical protein [Candidatus Obscuribacterales bacterium]